jgi:hypothetical protein
MILYILAMNPFLHTLQQHGRGVRILNHTETATAYADDVTIFLDSEQAVASITRALDEYRHVSGAHMNKIKSKALSIGEWDKSVNIYTINYQAEIKILGIWFTNNISVMSPLKWEPVVRNIRLAAQELSIRNSCLLHKIWYVQTYVLSKVWYTAKILPIENRYVRQINGAIAYYIWTRNIFRVAMTTLQKERDGGLGMTDIECKCNALLLSTGYKLFKQHDSFTSQWLTYCFKFADIQNPPNIKAVPRDLQYIRIFLQEWSYITVPGDPRDTRVCSVIYRTLIHHGKIRSQQKQMRIVQKQPQARWGQTWRNIASPFLPATVSSEWYRVVHDIVPTNDRMHKIGLMDTDLCTTCRTPDTLEHKLTRCNITKIIWAWLACTLAKICRRHPAIFRGVMLL